MRPRLWGVALVAEAKRMLASPTCFNEAPAVSSIGTLTRLLVATASPTCFNEAPAVERYLKPAAATLAGVSYLLQ